MIGVISVRADQAETDCHDLNNRILARWTYYTTFGNPVADADTGDKVAPYADRLSLLLAKAAQRTADLYSDVGVNIYALGDVPMQPFEPQSIYKEAYLAHADVMQSLHARSVTRQGPANR